MTLTTVHNPLTTFMEEITVTTSTAQVQVGDKTIGDGYPVYIIGEIGINHNGSLALAKKMIDGAVFAGCDAVKF